MQLLASLEANNKTPLACNLKLSTTNSEINRFMGLQTQDTHLITTASILWKQDHPIRLMTGTEKPLGSVPKRLEEDILDVYRLMPSRDTERLMNHIAWMESEISRLKRLQQQTETELKRVNGLLKQQKTAIRLKSF